MDAFKDTDKESNKPGSFNVFVFIESKKETADKESCLVFFVCNKEAEANKFAGVARQKIAEELNLIDNSSFNFCWIIDFPMFHYDEKEKKIDFSHNPFSMPQTDIGDFDQSDPLEILAYQYDLVCNGYELSSGAIRNHITEYLFKVLSKMDHKNADALFVSCTALPVLSILNRLEKKIKKIVISSNQALIWDTLEKIGKNNSITDFGKLFKAN